MTGRSPSAGPYGVLTADLVAPYIRSNPALSPLLDAEGALDVTEVGDGNLNLVFVARDAAGRGLVLKQALPYVRLVGPSWPMTPERAVHEAEALAVHGALAPDLVTRVHAFDSGRFILALEDLSDHTVWRTALNRGERHDGVAEDLGVYVARAAFGTSVLALAADAHKEAVARSVNAELCGITEALVLTEPFVGADRNSMLPANESDARELAGDSDMVAAMGRARWRFMTRAEALIHGDLHTGSVMVRDDGSGGRSTKVFDAEFAFYGPVGFDLGLLWANYVIAAARAFALGEDGRAAWCLSLPARTQDAFEAEFRRLWPERRDPGVFTDRMLEGLLAGFRDDSLLFCGAEAARRIVGLAKTSDIETLDERRREGAARGVLGAARLVATASRRASDPRALWMAVAELLARARTT